MGKAAKIVSIFYLAYGSNLNTSQMKKRCPTAEVVGKTKLKDYRLSFKGMPGGGIATVVPDTGSLVPVLIWKLKPQDEASLDIYEGYPNLYRKEYYDIRVNDRKHKAMYYVLNEPFYDVTNPSEHYYKTILAGYQEAGFDEEILKKASLEAGDGSPLTKKVIRQIMTIRNEGLTNMLDLKMVQYLANQHGFYELVLFIEDYKSLYVDFILRGKKPS